ncbi:hypothetical protein Q5705_17740 [Kosakonia sp. H02]|nr:hypothetical protein Q5705_17740 [Kosakonia sp. H02]
MKITGANGYVILSVDGRAIKIAGERIIGGFVAEITSMRNFEPPFEHETLTEEIKSHYIAEVTKKTKHSNFVIHFV